MPIFLSLHGWAPVRNHSVYSARDKTYYSDKEHFCDWTPWGGYNVGKKAHDTTFLTLSPGGDCSSYRDLFGKKKRTVVEVDMGPLENPVPGVTTFTNEHGRTLRYRQDEKWVCDTCTNFCMGAVDKNTVAILQHGFGQCYCKNNKSGGTVK